MQEKGGWGKYLHDGAQSRDDPAYEHGQASQEKHDPHRDEDGHNGVVVLCDRLRGEVGSPGASHKGGGALPSLPHCTSSAAAKAFALSPPPLRITGADLLIRRPQDHSLAHGTAQSLQRSSQPRFP